MKDTRVPMLLVTIAYWVVAMPLGLFLAFTLDMRASGMWIGLTAGFDGRRDFCCSHASSSARGEGSWRVPPFGPDGTGAERRSA